MMKRKVTGWFLFMLMTVFTVTAHTNLRYCLCANAITIGECGCDLDHISALDDQQSTSCDCCNSCEQTESKTESLDQNRCLDSDCMVDLIFQLDHFVLSSGDPLLNTRLDSEVIQPLYGNYIDHSIQSVILTSAICAPRGSPPPNNRLNVPIYLRDSVYRI